MIGILLIKLKPTKCPHKTAAIMRIVSFMIAVCFTDSTNSGDGMYGMMKAGPGLPGMPGVSLGSALCLMFEITGVWIFTSHAPDSLTLISR